MMLIHGYFERNKEIYRNKLNKTELGYRKVYRIDKPLLGENERIHIFPIRNRLECQFTIRILKRFPVTSSKSHFKNPWVKYLCINKNLIPSNLRVLFAKSGKDT